MPNRLQDRFKHAWNAFLNKDPTNRFTDYGMATSYRPDRVRFTRGNERSIATAVYNRIALDVSATTINHVRLDENGRFAEVIDSGLNNCLTVEANADQTGRAFLQDVVMSMLDEGCVAVIPTDMDTDPMKTTSMEILALRTGKIMEWYPSSVKVKVYNERTGQKEDITLSKSTVAIIENPLYAVINEPSSTMQRLIRKLNLLDSIDEQSGSGKLDLIIQLPYLVKTEARRQQAENRRKEIENQLAGSKYGIAYTDGTEHITQLNRAVENNLMSQIEYLTSMLYSQLGITIEILNGTASEDAMINYLSRTIEPIVSAIVDEMKRKFLTKTARSQKQSIYFFRDPFKLVPVSQIAEIADKFTRNEIMTSNEIRQIIGMPKSDDPEADELRNKNLNKSNEQTAFDEENLLLDESGDAEGQLASLEALEAELEGLMSDLDDDEEKKELKHYASPYYDPVKAHEYYEEHKKLKGRTSSSGLNTTGKEAYKYVKDQLSAEKKQRIEKAKSERDSSVSSAQNAKTSASKAETEQTTARIAALREKVKKMTPEQKRVFRERVAGQIDALRRAAAQKKQQLAEQYSREKESANSKYKSEHESATNDYNSKLEAELNKIKSDKSMLATKKGKKSSTKESKEDYWAKERKRYVSQRDAKAAAKAASRK